MGRRAKKKDSTGLGRAIVKAYREDRHAPQAGVDDIFSLMHTTEASDTMKLKSHLEVNDLEAFMSNAMLADQDFTAIKENVVVITSEGKNLEIDPVKQKAAEEKHRDAIRVPRRPHWDETTTPDVLQQKEKESFLVWRKMLSEAEQTDHLIITPFEKNLEVWRQLWRVVERSHIVAQIVDCRNPLLFRCPDLEKYVQECKVGPSPKRNLVIMNKADFLNKNARIAWAAYFKQQGIDFIFFSAFKELEKIEAAIAAHSKAVRMAEVEDDEEEGSDTDPAEAALKQKAAAAADSIATALGGKPKKKFAPTHIYTREELLDKLKALGAHVDPAQQVVVGMVGYPNVGKSSTINSLFKDKKVSVSSTPGKTKHFQTIHIDPRLMLCDCPGLVFPNFSNSKADLICNGILPIDQMRSHYEPMDLVCQRVPRKTLEDIYGVVLPKPRENEMQKRPPRGTELAQAYAYVRGYMTSSGRPDESRASRIILKDYVNGRILYAHKAPGYEGIDFSKLARAKSAKKAAAAAPPEGSSSLFGSANPIKEDSGDEDEEMPILAETTLQKKQEKKTYKGNNENRAVTAKKFQDDELGVMAGYTEVRAMITPVVKPGANTAAMMLGKKHKDKKKKKTNNNVGLEAGFNVQVGNVSAIKQTGRNDIPFSRPSGGGFTGGAGTARPQGSGPAPVKFARPASAPAGDAPAAGTSGSQ